MLSHPTRVDDEQAQPARMVVFALTERAIKAVLVGELVDVRDHIRADIVMRVEADPRLQNDLADAQLPRGNLGQHPLGSVELTSELHKALVPSRGLFASGKLDQYKRDIPYAILGEAFQSLVRSLLGRSEAELGRWRDALLEASGYERSTRREPRS
jgi:hypothetical protein